MPRRKAAKALTLYLELHPVNIEQVVSVIIEHFRLYVMHEMGGRAKAMVVAGSRLAAVKYKLAFDRYIKDHSYTGIRSLVAFLGTVEEALTRRPPMSLLLGFALVAALGVAHHYGLLAVRAIKPNSNDRPQAAIIAVFLGLLALHTLEIVAFAAVYRALLAWGILGDLGGASDETWGGLIYFSGINFATLGYTQIETSGPIRIVNMMQSLGGFMVLTWSATFLYSVCERAWRD